MAAATPAARRICESLFGLMVSSSFLCTYCWRGADIRSPEPCGAAFDSYACAGQGAAREIIPGPKTEWFFRAGVCGKKGRRKLKRRNYITRFVRNNIRRFPCSGSRNFCVQKVAHRLEDFRYSPFNAVSASPISAPQLPGVLRSAALFRIKYRDLSPLQIRTYFRVI